jgi:hypothetical protein
MGIDAPAPSLRDVPPCSRSLVRPVVKCFEAMQATGELVGGSPSATSPWWRAPSRRCAREMVNAVDGLLQENPEVGAYNQTI